MCVLFIVRSAWAEVWNEIGQNTRSVLAHCSVLHVFFHAIQSNIECPRCPMSMCIFLLHHLFFLLCCSSFNLYLLANVVCYGFIRKLWWYRRTNSHSNHWDNNFVINLFGIYFLELNSFSSRFSKKKKEKNLKEGKQQQKSLFGIMLIWERVYKWISITSPFGPILVCLSHSFILFNSYSYCHHFLMIMLNWFLIFFCSLVFLPIPVAMRCDMRNHSENKLRQML